MMNSENFAHNFIDSFMNVDQTVFVPFIMMQLKIFGQKFQIRRAVFFLDGRWFWSVNWESEMEFTAEKKTWNEIESREIRVFFYSILKIMKFLLEPCFSVSTRRNTFQHDQCFLHISDNLIGLLLCES